MNDGLRPTVGDRFRVIWDFPGLGKSSKPKNNDHFIEKYARDRDLEAVVPTLAMFRLDETQTFATINVPVLVICGASDIVTKTVVSDRLKAEIPYSEKVIIIQYWINHSWDWNLNDFNYGMKLKDSSVNKLSPGLGS